MKRLKKDLLNDRGDGSMEVSICIWLVVFVFMVMVVIEIFAAVIAAVNLNQAADTIAKQIQIEGVVNQQTFDVFEEAMKSHGNIGAPALEVTLSSTGETITVDALTEKKIQLGESYTVAVTGTVGLGGYKMSTEDAHRITIPLSARTVGVSERYWKDA